MKTIKFILIALTSMIICEVKAQEYKLSKTSGRLEIMLGKVTVESTSGSEIIFTSSERENNKDERANGLKQVSSLGLEDNTGLGINVATEGTVTTVRQMKKTNSPKIKILVPKGVIVSFSHESQYGGDANFRNLENEIEVSAQYNNIDLENCSGPVTVKTIYGHVEAVFDSNSKGPMSIVSVYGYADVTLPVATKANLRLSTSYGEIYVAPEFKIEINQSGDSEDRVSGKINGGGMNIDISSSYGKVYLRKK